MTMKASGVPRETTRLVCKLYIPTTGKVYIPRDGTASRDRSNIGGGRVFSTTLLSFVLCSLLYAHEVPARQG